MIKETFIHSLIYIKVAKVQIILYWNSNNVSSEQRFVRIFKSRIKTTFLNLWQFIEKDISICRELTQKQIKCSMQWLIQRDSWISQISLYNMYCFCWCLYTIVLLCTICCCNMMYFTLSTINLILFDITISSYRNEIWFKWWLMAVLPNLFIVWKIQTLFMILMV